MAQSTSATGLVNSKTFPAGEDLRAGDLVNLYRDNGVKARKASAASLDRKVDGFVLRAALEGGSVTVYFDGVISGLSGVPAGSLFLSETHGKVAGAPPTAPGMIVQQVGIGVSESEIIFESGQIYQIG